MPRLTFGDFALDLASGDLRRGEEIVDLRPKLHALLLYMVERPGRLLSKEELMAAVWMETHVADGSLNRAITELRDVLGDHAMIETVPRRGYRFVAQVSAGERNGARTVSAFLVMHGDRRLVLFEGENIVGRTPDCEVQIPFGSVSRHHARIIVGDRITIEDLGSTNGTFANERQLDSVTEIHPGDAIRIGKENIRLLSQEALHATTDRLK